MRRWSLPWTRPTLPPAIDAVFELGLDQVEDPEEVRRVFGRGLRRTLIRETEWATTWFPYVLSRSRPVDQPLTVALDVASTPFGPYSSECSKHTCRGDSARVIATSLGLYADRIILPDQFSGWFINEEPLDWSDIVSDLRALRELRPLIMDGSIRFSNPVPRLCRECFQSYSDEAKVASRAVADILRSRLTAHTKGESDSFWLDVDVPGETVSSLKFHRPPEISEELLGAHALEEFSKYLAYTASLDYSQRLIAHELNGLLISNHPIPILQLRAQCDEEISLSSFSAWRREHSVELPWVSQLTVEQIVQLRHEAARALPRLREQLSVWTMGSQELDLKQRIAELRESIVELDIELSALQRKNERTFARTFGGVSAIGLTLGVAAGAVMPGTALATLIGVLGVVHGFERHDGREEGKLKSRPAYALLQAKRILGSRSP